MKTVYRYRSNILQLMGGELGFDLLVATYCENIQDGKTLDRYFGHYDLKTLIRLQKELLLLSFLEADEETEQRQQRVMFRNDMMGIDGSIFPVLEQHFVDALEDCCIGDYSSELCKAYFSELRALFKDCTGDSKYRENIVERMGGESTFEFLVLSYCERLENDERLSCYFKHLGSSANLTLVQKELILLAFLHPKANNDFESLKERVRSSFSPLFELGMNGKHFKMMQSHFFAAINDCLSEPKVIVIETSLRLFSNLITIFDDNLLLSKSGGYGEYDVDDENIVSEIEDDEDDSISSILENCSILSIPPPPEAIGHGSNSFQDLLSPSERLSKSFLALDMPYRPMHSPPIHSRKKNTDDRTSYVSKRIQNVLNRSDASKQYSSDRTEDTLPIDSNDRKTPVLPAVVVHQKLSKTGRAIMPFSWKPRSRHSGDSRRLRA